jgi:Zn-dependent M28 family amino/carboxypeptidase
MRKLFFTFSALFFLSTLYGQERSDPDMISNIKKEGSDNSKVMYIAHHLTDVSGPRLTNSPGFLRAANWAKDELTKWGLINAQLEPWGEFGKGWQQEKCYVAMTSPYYQPLIAVPRAWTLGTKKLLKGEVILIKAQDTASMVQYAGKLKDKIVMTWSAAQLKPSFDADGRRFADTSLERMALAEMRQPGGPNQPQQQNAQRQNRSGRFAIQRRINALINQEKPALILSMDASGNDGTVFVASGGQYSKNAAEAPANVMLSSDDYLRLQRLIEDGIKVEIEADIKTKFFDNDMQGYNVIAEIPGTDPKLKDEIVMLGGHLDSWHGATGATDNAAGCSVMMEAVRILKTLNIQPRRTIRIALWSGEEEGLLGSRAYVKNHLADTANGQWLLKPEHSKISAYYNLDNGTGKIRGVYLQGNEAERTIFAKWLESFTDEGAKTITIDNTGGTDHLSFDRAGIPGFQFIQDEIEYDTRTHHTNMDTYDHLVPEDLKQAAAIVASFVYNTAQRDEKMPRKAMPPARPVQQRGF